MGSRPLRQQLWLLVALLCLVTLTVTLVSLLGLTRQGDEVTELTDVTGPALSMNSAILQTMTNAETGLRGYIATGNPVLLAPYNSAERQTSVQLSELDALLDKSQLSGYDPRVTVQQTDAQDAAVARWWQYAASARAEGRQAQGSLVAGKAIFDQVRRANAALASTLLAAQHVLRTRAGQTVGYYLAALLAVTALALLAGLAVAGRLSTTVTGPINRLRQVVQRQREGETSARADEDDGPVEIRDLATAFNSLSTRSTELAAEQAEAIRLQQEVFAVGRAIRFATSVQEAMQITCAQLGPILRARRVTATTIDSHPKVTAGAQWYEPGMEDLPEPRAEWEPRLCQTAAELWASGGQLAISDLLAEDIQGEDGSPEQVHRETGATALILAPAGLGDRIVGAVCVMMDTGPRTWTDAEVAVVQQVANFLARAIVRAEHDAQSAEYTARLERLDRQKTEFLSTVSHELRTPLTSIQGYLELLRDGDAGQVREDQMRMLDIIDRNATRLRGLIEDILVLNRIETGGLVPGTSEVSLRDLAVDTAEELQPPADKAGVELRVHVGADPGPVIGDRTQLQRALVNILSNAIKFTPRGGTVTLACRTDPADKVVISCQDTGIGIPKADIEHLFTRFFRASNATGMAIPGTGLGLAIVAAIMDVHHGQLTLNTAEGEGTTITLHFPRASVGIEALRGHRAPGEIRRAHGGSSHLPRVTLLKVKNLLLCVNMRGLKKTGGALGGRKRLVYAGGVLATLVAAVAGVVVVGALGTAGRDGPSWAPSVRQVGGLRTIATATPAGYTLFTAHGPVRFLAGMDLGATTPGHLPGELAITAADDSRWLAEMGALGVHAVRIYTIHPPAFYQALAAYDTSHPADPIFLIQGVYLANDDYLTAQNLYDPGNTDAFRQELRDAAAAVHGTLVRPFRHGFASGQWTADVSQWTAGWIIGVEWDPYATAATDRKNPRAPAVHGRYFTSTPDATPAERWLAARMNDMAADEAATGWTAPIAFANWPTADPLRHPNEPNPQEDMVGVDANHVLPTRNWPGGTFASFHVYPYYPDFLQYQPSLQNFIFDGRKDAYAGYLHDLLEHFKGKMPLMITEFGVPSSLGSAHNGTLGRSQGDHTEEQAMHIDAQVLVMMRQLGMAGGFVFEWTDEWYKRTWNTELHQIPQGNLQLWHDVFTNEQYFGVVAADPLPFAPPAVIYRAGAGTGVRQVTAWEDESYVHLTFTFARPPAGDVTIGLDTVPGITGPPPPGSSDHRASYALVLDLTRRTGQAWVRGKLDPDQIDYAPIPASARPASRDGWQELELLTDRPWVLPLTHQQTRMQFDNVGLLRDGDWNPSDPDYDSQALWHLHGTELDLRFPWAMAGMSDPSSHQALIPLGEFRATSITIPGIGLTISGGSNPALQAGTVSWQNWQTVQYTERVKPGVDALRQAFNAVSTP